MDCLMNSTEMVSVQNNISFKGKKRKFAESLKELDPVHFKEFVPLFDKLQYLISDKSNLIV